MYRFLYISLGLFILTACGASGSDSNVGTTRQTLDLNSDSDNCGAVGYACVGGRSCDTGKCLPAWLPISTVNAPTPRGVAAAAAIDGKYVILGGCSSSDYNAPPEASTAAYDPVTDSWNSLPDLNSPRAQHSAVSTPYGVFTYGGLASCWDGYYLDRGMEQLPNISSTSWIQSSIDNAPPSSYNTGMAWKDNSLMIFGGSTNEAAGIYNSGLYDPVHETWQDSSCLNEGCERTGGVQMFADGISVHIYSGGSTGLSYEGGYWFPWDAPESLNAFYGSRQSDDGRRLYSISTNGVAIYDRSTAETISDSSTMPSGICPEGPSAWTGSELIVYSGICGDGFSAVGGRYQPPAPQ
jgi:hypothetical protein